MQRLWVLVVAEFLVLVLLAVQVFAAPPAAVADARTPPEASAATAETAPIAAPAAARTEAEPSGPVRESVTSRHDPADPAGILLHGTVTARDGAGVPKATVYVREDGGGRSVTSAANGGYACAGLRPGTYRLTATADGFVQREVECVLGDEAVQRCDVALDPSFPVRVRIETPDGRDATAIAQNEFNLHFGFHVVGSAEPIPEKLAATEYSIVWHGDARWERAERPKDGVAGTLHLASSPPAYAAVLLRHVVLAQQRIESGQEEVKFVVDAAAAAAKLGTIRMRLLDDASSAPLADVRCTARSSSGGGAHAKSGADGVAVLERVLPGLLILELEGGKANESVTTTIRVQPGETRDLGDLRLGAVLELSGKLLDADGKPAHGSIQWTALRWRTEPREFVGHRSSSVEADGTFKLWRAGPGSYAITARAPDGRIAAGVFDNPPQVPVELRLAAPGMVIVTRPADPGQSYTLTLYDPLRRPVAARTFPNRLTRWVCPLAAGEFTYEIHDDGDRVVQGGPLRVGGEPVTLAIRGDRP